MSSSGTEYDAVVYPSGLFTQTHPDRMSVIARMHGLTTPPIETARILDIGGGDGLNVIAMAVAYSDARILSFDLSETAARRGAKIVEALGLDNITVGMGDILDAARDLDQQFDYIIAHGIYAWVPLPVRQALLSLIARVLSPTGVAFMSYNALPGGHLRQIIRDMALHHVAHIDDREARLREAHAFIARFGEPLEGDTAVLRGLRAVARPIARKQTGVLYHDELGEIFDPQSVTQVAEAASDHGLAYLNDAHPTQCQFGFVAEAPDEAARLRRIQTLDHSHVAFFRSTLLVRADRPIGRALNSAAIAGLWITSRAERVDRHDFRLDGEIVTIGDDALADFLESLAAIWPGRRRVSEAIAQNDTDRLTAIGALFFQEFLDLHVAPLPGVRTAGSYPEASVLARFQVARGGESIFTLDHRMMAMADPGPRAFLSLLDGSRDRETLAADWAASDHGAQISVEDALDQLGRAVVLKR